MIDGEGEAPDNNFAEFEAAATAAPVVADDKPADERRDDDPADPETNDKLDDPDADDPPAEEGKDAKPRSKPLHQRLGEVTEKWRNTEQERDAERERNRQLETRLAALERGEKPAAAEPELTAPDPNDDKYDFGEADPKYIADMVRYETKKELAEERKAAKEADAETAKTEEARKFTADVDTKWAEQAAKGAEKYDDFKEKVLDTAAAGDWACPPLIAAGISLSPVGHDVAYHLANHSQEAELIAAKLVTNPMSAAEDFGMLEGQFMDKAPERPGADSHPIDIAQYAGRLKGYLDAQGKKGTARPSGATDAPEPPRHGVRGAGGKFEVGGDTTDFAAFEAKANAGLGGRR